MLGQATVLGGLEGLMLRKLVGLWWKLSVVGLLSLSASLYAAEIDLQPDIQVKLERLGPADSRDYLISVDFDLPAGMHQFRQDEYFTIALSPGMNGITAGAIRYPPTNAEVAGLPAWSGRVRLQLPIKFPQTGADMPGRLGIKAAWQICYDSGICLRPASRELWLDIPTVRHSLDLAILWYLLLAFVGGLILNLMPCVLPVLALKTMGLLRHAANDPHARMRHGLATVAGIIVSMMGLAGLIVGLQAGGRLAGWGFQFQSPWYTMTLSLVILAFALSLWGVWVLRAPVFRFTSVTFKPGTGGSLAGSFLNGVLTVVLATQCTAPFLGTALGFAFAAPPIMVFLVLLACGIGLALPFFLLAVLPAALRFLPKPGPWMDRLSHIMGFALAATFVWLLSIIYHQIVGETFIAFLWCCLAVTILLRVFGWLQDSGLSRVGRRTVGLGLLLLAVGLAVWFVPQVLTIEAGGGVSQKKTSLLPAPWQAFDENAIAALQANGLPVFIDFTAEWCLTCKLNEAGALADPAVLSAFRKAGMALFRGDYTNGDPRIDQWLARYGRAGVPFYLVLRADGSHSVLPELLDSATLLRIAQQGSIPTE